MERFLSLHSLLKALISKSGRGTEKSFLDAVDETAIPEDSRSAVNQRLYNVRKFESLFRILQEPRILNHVLQDVSV
jgi:hypothetical protein